MSHPAATQHLRFACLAILALTVSNSVRAADLSFPLKARRLLFIGDSITYAGGYVAHIETQLRLQGVEPLPEIIGIGLPSETCTGLSEPDHPFPRPDVHERLERALTKLKPDAVVACYGMNDGIYYPFSEERFQAYQDGINLLIKKVHATKAKLVLMTPPAFDPLPLRAKGKLKPAGAEKYAWFEIYEDYDDVMRRYAEWIMQQRDRVEMVVDLHSPMTRYLAEKRKTAPQFSVTSDGVHPNAEGERVLGDAILKAWGVKLTREPDAKLFKLMAQRVTVLRDAWLSEVGHKRPGVRPGLPVKEATAKAAALNAEIAALIENSR